MTVLGQSDWCEIDQVTFSSEEEEFHTFMDNPTSTDRSQVSSSNATDVTGLEQSAQHDMFPMSDDFNKLTPTTKEELGSFADGGLDQLKKKAPDRNLYVFRTKAGKMIMQQKDPLKGEGISTTNKQPKVLERDGLSLQSTPFTFAP